MNDMKFTTAADYMNDAMRIMQDSKNVAKNRIEELLEQELRDEDGYPTEAALEIVSLWHWTEPEGWFQFIKSIWWAADWGWNEKDEPHEYKEGETVHRYYVSTGGWSGNESIIKAMEKNEMMWHWNWVQSRRGGHYIFELRELKDD
jgi:hypothetical protein